MTDKPRVVLELLQELNTKIMVGLGVNITSQLVKDTPKDTRFASVNWVPEVGGQFEGTAGTRELAEQGSLEEGPQRSGLQRVAGYKLEQGNITISNNVDYIVKLNEGSSQQAPSGFVQAAIEKGIKSLSTRRPSRRRR